MMIRIDRLCYIEDLSIIWTGPLSISVYIRTDQLKDLSNWINHHKHIPKLRLAIYIAITPGPDNNYVTIVTYGKASRRNKSLWIYPINYLRDLAIMNVKTTHYLNMDMDMWPSCMIDHWKSFYSDDVRKFSEDSLGYSE